MSKIYEALLRAELDRVAAEKNGSLPTDELIPLVRTSNRTESENESPVNPVPSAKQVLSTPFPGIPSVFGEVRQTEWKPDFAHLPALLQKGSAVEQFRSLRSHLYELRATKDLKSVLISSGLPQEGKSFIAVNLALSLALHKNSKVLLIDGDMRRYTLHKLLGCDSKPGLAEYLSGESRLLDVMQQTTLPRDAANKHNQRLEALTFIAGGNGGEAAADLSSNKRFDELIAAVSPYFDWIIVDSSPVNLVSDAANLARACDGVLLVARAGKTQINTAQRAIAEFKNADVLGFVLNASQSASKTQGYYGYDATDEGQD
jgi:capsular exopolysaccharide synthesis family protein